MKKYALFLGLLLAPLFSLAQTFFEYDQAGNRIKRTFTPLPNLFAIIQVTPTTIYGPSPIIARLQIVEINNVATSGLITVKLTRQTNVPFSFNPATTTLSGASVQNANWSFDNSDPSYYVFTSTTPIAGYGVSTIGLEGVVNSGFPGVITISMVIVGGSGGELKIDDNAAATKLNYFR